MDAFLAALATLAQNPDVLNAIATVAGVLWGMRRSIAALSSKVDAVAAKVDHVETRVVALEQKVHGPPADKLPITSAA